MKKLQFDTRLRHSMWFNTLGPRQPSCQVDDGKVDATGGGHSQRVAVDFEADNVAIAPATLKS